MTVKTNESGVRQLTSWIDAFVEHTANTESPLLLRRWAAISTLASVMEQKVWLETSSPMYPNLYTFLISPPGIGKSRAISAARGLLESFPETAPNRPHIAPTSVTAATLVDSLADSRQIIIRPPAPPLDYHSMSLHVGEFGTFMSKYEDDLMALLTDFYDVTPYRQRRRGNNLDIKIAKPQLNMLIGSTPSMLMKFMPEGAWDQGFTSRSIFVYSSERRMINDFEQETAPHTAALRADLTIVNNLVGRFHVTEAYADAVNNWRRLDENVPPKPTHPRLLHYNTRRKGHLYRLSMVSAIDRGNVLILERSDFNRAMGWLLEVETTMPMVFSSPSSTSDASTIAEIRHHVADYNMSTGLAMSEHKLFSFARDKIPGRDVARILDLMLFSGTLVIVGTSRSGIRSFQVGTEGSAPPPDATALLN